jgi:hypothetical protein
VRVSLLVSPSNTEAETGKAKHYFRAMRKTVLTMFFSHSSFPPTLDLIGGDSTSSVGTLSSCCWRHVNRQPTKS